MHPLLERQLRRHLGLDTIPEEWRALLQAIDAAYAAADEDRALRERSMELMVEELSESNRLLRREKTEQAALIKQLEMAQRQLVQSEKLASIGQLAAGIAHEINNPIGFVHSNMRTLDHYFAQLLHVLNHFETCRAKIASSGKLEESWLTEVETLMAEADYAYLKEDIPVLLAESLEGTERVRRIVKDLRDFSRTDTAQQWEMADLCAGLDSTLNIVTNEIKYRAEVKKDYGMLPRVECIPSQLNQVFMNLLVNAAQAIPEGQQGLICLRCGSTGEDAWVEIADNGTGIAPEDLSKIFDPFYTTKPIGKGTGLGLSLSYGIVEKHNGRIEVQSTLGTGTTFRVVIPLQRRPAENHIPPAADSVPPASTFEKS